MIYFLNNNKNISFLYRKLSLQNVEIIVADISTFEMEGSYDRIFSIEMFEVLINMLNFFWKKKCLLLIWLDFLLAFTAYEKL